MFNKIDFTDLYRFLTSIGLVVIALAILTPWLYTNSSSGHISIEEYHKLTIASKNLIDNQIKLNTLVLSVIPYATPALFIVGLLISAFGIRRWKGKQEEIDLIDKMNLQERLDRLTPSEVEEKVQKEAKEEIAKSDEKFASKISNDEIQALGQKILNVEEQFFRKITELNPHSYEAFSNMRIDEKAVADIYLRSHDQKKNRDILVEIRYLQKRLSTQVLRNAYESLTTTYAKYHTSTHRLAYVVLVIVYNEKIASHEEFRRFQVAVESLGINQNKAFRFFLISDKEVANFDIKFIGIN